MVEDESAEDPGAGRHPVRFLFDFISPNAYIAWTQVHDLAGDVGRSVEPVPVLFAGLLKAHGLSGPAEISAKWRWMLRDVLRKTHDLGIPFCPPESHPFNPLAALRVSSLDLPPGERRRLIDALFRAVWAEGKPVRDPNVVAEVASAVGLDGRELVERANRSDNKERLRRATEEAVAQGVFGVPTIVADGQLFWGYDDFRHLERFLRGDDPIDLDRLHEWTGIRSTATRRR